MSADDKAKELVDAFYKYCQLWDASKLAANKCVDEIMNSYETENDHHGSVYKYWQQVKEKIQQL